MTTPLADAIPLLAVTFGFGIVVFSLLWLIHGRIRDASIVDYWWAGGFAAIAWTEYSLGPGGGSTQLFVTLAVTLWAVRLTVHMAARHRARGFVEDRRYARFREAGGPDWPRRNLFSIFWLQAAVQWALALPIHAVMLAPALADPAEVAVLLGTALFFAGLGIEWIADLQLARFKAGEGRDGRIFTGGLWAWSRHPNYFGEAMLWWGLGLVAVGATGAWWVLAAPAALTFLLVKVSGVQPLEAELAGRPGWADYAARTSAFLPRPPRGWSRRAVDRKMAPDQGTGA